MVHAESSHPCRRLVQLAVIALIAWTLWSVGQTYPHHLSYFNEAAGGPENGWKHMLGSNFE